MALQNGKYLKRLEVEIENISPLNISGNNDEPLVDIEENKVYFPGTILVGAIRSYLFSIGTKNIEDMFGNEMGSDTNRSSKVFVYDSYSDLLGIEVRPGVHIDRFSGTSMNKAKFERKYVCEGHKFNLHIDIYGKDNEQAKEYGKNIYTALGAINNGNISFGSYKTGGSGIFKVNFIKEVDYDFTCKKDLFMYLKDSKDYKLIDIKNIFSENVKKDMFVRYELEGEIETPLLVRGISTLDYKRADGEQFVNKKRDPIIPGTSLKGVIRSQGERILKLYKKESFIEKIFGSGNDTEMKIPSRFTAYDSKVENAKKSIYNKIKIDRFTGGVINSQKMEEEPITGEVKICGKLKIDRSYEKDMAVGLIALIFRDIAKGEVTIGSGESIGKGRIKGSKLSIFAGNDVLFKWNMKQSEAEVNKIDDYISALKEE